MASTRFILSPAINLPLSVKASTTNPLLVPLFPFPPINSPSFRLTSKRNVAAAASVSGSNAVSEQIIESVSTDTSQDAQAALSRPSSSKLVLVVGGTGGVGNSHLLRLFFLLFAPTLHTCFSTGLYMNIRDEASNWNSGKSAFLVCLIMWSGIWLQLVFAHT